METASIATKDNRTNYRTAPTCWNCLKFKSGDAGYGLCSKGEDNLKTVRSSKLCDDYVEDCNKIY